jgi:hypothetical protein
VSRRMTSLCLIIGCMAMVAFVVVVLARGG